MDVHLIDPIAARNAIAAGFGSFMCILVTRKMGWLNVLTLFIVGQITAYYFTVPIAAWFGRAPNMYGVIGFTIGAFAMMVWGALINLIQNLHDDPQGTITWLWRLVKGGAGPPDPKDKGGAK